MDIKSIYALNIDDKPTEEDISVSFKKQMDQLMLIENIAKKKGDIDAYTYVNKTIEELQTELNLLNNQ